MVMDEWKLTRGFRDSQPEESRTLLDELLPETLTFSRKPIAVLAADPEPVVHRSPSLAANAATSPQATSGTSAEPAASAVDTTSIFGSVSATDILTRIREALLADRNGSRVALEAEGITIVGLEEGEDRIKHLGRWEVDVVTGKGIEPVRRIVEVVAEGEEPLSA
jgi:hypothetical protein